MTEALCPHFEDHTLCPEGYIQWHAWAEKMSRTHKHVRCGGCNLFVIWVPKQARKPRPVRQHLLQQEASNG